MKIPRKRKTAGGDQRKRPTATETPPKSPKQPKTTPPATTTPKKPGALDGQSGSVKALTGFTAVFVLGLSTVVALVVIGTQVGFYQEKMQVKEVEQLWNLDLTLFTPVAVEGIVWAFTFMAVVLVLLNRTSAFWLRAMWAFASVAALVNGWHAISQSDVLGGIVTGGLSLAGPFTVHGFVYWVRQITTGKTVEQSKTDTAERWRRVRRGILAVLGTIADHVVHPAVALRAISIWRGVREYSYANAWHLSATAYRRELHRSVVAKSLGKKVKDLAEDDLEAFRPGGGHPEVATPQQDQNGHPGHPVETGGGQGVATPPVATPDDPEMTDLLATLEGVATPADLLGTWSGGHPEGGQGVATPPSSENEGGHPGGQEGGQGVATPGQEGGQGGGQPEVATPGQQGGHPSGGHPSNDEVATPENTGGHPRKRSGQQGGHPSSEKAANGTAKSTVRDTTTGSMNPKDLAVEHYRSLRRQGYTDSEISASAVADELGIGRTSVRRGFQEARDTED